MVDEDQVAIVSNSYGEPESAEALERRRGQRAGLPAGRAARASTFFFSSGDNGDEQAATGTLQADYPASDPYITSVGGTVDRDRRGRLAGVPDRLGDAEVRALGRRRVVDAAGLPVRLGRRLLEPVQPPGLPEQGDPAGVARGPRLPRRGRWTPTRPPACSSARPRQFPSGARVRRVPDRRHEPRLAADGGRAGADAAARGRAPWASSTRRSTRPARTGRGSFLDVAGPGPDAGNVRADYVNSLDPSGGIVYSVRTFNQDSSLAVGAGLGRRDRLRLAEPEVHQRVRRVVRAACQAWPVIARVEPLTTTRRLSGPFDYRVEGPVEVGSLVRMPFGHQKLDGVVVGVAETSRGPGREARRRHVGARGLDPARPRRPRAVDGRGVLLDARAGARAGLAAAGQGQDARSGPSRRAPTGGSTTTRRALLARLPGPAGGDLAALRRLEKRGLVAISERVARRAPRTNPAPDRARRAQRRAGGRRWRRSRPHRARRTCCTASPARARPRSTCARRRPRWSAARA